MSNTDTTTTTELRADVLRRARARRDRLRAEAAASITEADIAAELHVLAFERLFARRLAELSEQAEADELADDAMRLELEGLTAEDRASLRAAFDRGDLPDNHPLTEQFTAEQRTELIAELAAMPLETRVGALQGLVGVATGPRRQARSMTRGELTARLMHADIELHESRGANMETARTALATELGPPGSFTRELLADLDLSTEE